jgi:hypothetical protein
MSPGDLIAHYDHPDQLCLVISIDWTLVRAKVLCMTTSEIKEWNLNWATTYYKVLSNESR